MGSVYVGRRALFLRPSDRIESHETASHRLEHPWRLRQPCVVSCAPDGRPEGLAGNKRMILAIARAESHGAGSPTQAAEHAETYLRIVFGFIGMTNVEVISAEGVAIGPEQREAAILAGHSQIAALAA